MSPPPPPLEDFPIQYHRVDLKPNRIDDFSEDNVEKTKEAIIEVLKVGPHALVPLAWQLMIHESTPCILSSIELAFFMDSYMSNVEFDEDKAVWRLKDE